MPRRILEGDVVSDKMDKTVTVLVERRFRHGLYKKYIKRTDKFKAHDENNAFKTGDRVQIQECKPISAQKTWTVITPAKAGTSPAAKKTVDKPADQDAPAKETAKKPAAKKAETKKAPAKTAAKKETAAKSSEKKTAAKKTTAKKSTAKKKDESK